ncbi:MAG: hypothetical protein ACJ8AI_11435 [Rhodopila sp.]
MAHVVIDAPTTTPGGYTVTLPVNNTETVYSLSINATNNHSGSNDPSYKAAILELDGTLVFASGSPGSLGGSLQTTIHESFGDSAEIVNAGSVDGFIQVEGDLLLTGTNGVYFIGWLQALSGTVTIDMTTIAEINGNELFDGIFDARGPGAVIILGGPRQNLIVNVDTITGPPAFPEGWTEIFFNDPSAVIQEWNGSHYVPLQTTLKEIGARGTLDVLENSNYTTSNILTVAAGGALNLQAGTVTLGGLNIDGGVVDGFATIASNVVNNGTLLGVGGTLDVLGTLTGTGVVLFDQGGTAGAAGATMELHAVSAGQTIVMNGTNTLQLAHLIQRTEAQAAF